MSIEVLVFRVQRGVRCEGNTNVVAGDQEEAAVEAKVGGQVAEDVPEPVRIVEEWSREERGAVLDGRAMLLGPGDQVAHERGDGRLRHRLVEMFGVVQVMCSRRHLCQSLHRRVIWRSQILGHPLREPSVEPQLVAPQRVVGTK